jgi:hypothetical protein
MKTTVLLVLAMFIFSSCNSEETKTVNNAGNTTDSGGVDISGIDVKGLMASQFDHQGLCTQLEGISYRTHVFYDRFTSESGSNIYLILRYMTFANDMDCDDNNNETNVYEVIYTLDKAVITENGHVKLELTVDSHDAVPNAVNFDDYNGHLTSISIGEKEYWSIQLDLAKIDSDMVLPRGQDFLAPSSAETPNEGRETYVPITYVAVPL